MKKIIERSVYKAGEKLTGTEKIELNDETRQLLDKILKIEPNIFDILQSMEYAFQSTANRKFGEAILEKLGKKHHRISVYQMFGQSIKNLGETLKLFYDPLSDLLIKIGINEKFIGQSENEMCEIINKTFYEFIKDVLHKDYKLLHKELDELNTIRLDLEIIKRKVKKPQSNTDMSDKLCLQLDMATNDFINQEDRITKITKNIHENLLEDNKYIKMFIDKQIKHHQRCLDHLKNSKLKLKSYFEASENFDT